MSDVERLPESDDGKIPIIIWIDKATYERLEVIFKRTGNDLRSTIERKTGIDLKRMLDKFGGGGGTVTLKL